MSRALLENPALYRGDKPTPKEVDMLDGSKGTFYIADLRDHAAQQYFAERKQDGDDAVEQAEAKLCAAALREPDGSESITAELALTLKTSMRKRLVLAILEVNGYVTPDKGGENSAGN